MSENAGRRSSRPVSGNGTVVLQTGCLIVAGSALWLTFKDVDGRQVLEVLGAIGWLLPLVLVPQLLALSAETLAWRGVFARLDRSVAFTPLLSVRIVTEAIGRTLPAGAVLCESAKPMLLSSRCAVPLADGIAAMAGRKFLVLLSHAAYLSTAFVVGYAELRQASRSLGCESALACGVLGGAISLAIASAIMASVFRNGSVAQVALQGLLRLPLGSWRAKISARRAGFDDTDRRLTRLFDAPTRALPWPVFLCFLGWLFEAVESYLMLRLLGVELSFAAVLAIEAVVSFARHVLIVVPAGVGVQDVGYVALLAALGVPDAVNLGAAFAVLKRSKEAFWAVVGLGMWFGGARTASGTTGALHLAQHGPKALAGMT